MYTLLYSVFFKLKTVQKRHALNKVQQKMLDYIEWYYNVFWRKWVMDHPSAKVGVTYEKREQKVIISLTSFPKRINTIWLTIETLLRQSVRPDEIILWLADSQFDGLESLPESLLQLQKRGLTIRFCDDLRSHKKYYYVLQEHPEDLVILADDDLFYPRDTVKKLVRMHKQYPEDICCISAQVISPDFRSRPSLWRNPKPEEHCWQHSDQLQAFTGGGTLIPPRTLDSEVFDRTAIREFCPYADDLWIAFMAHRIGTKITTLKKWRPFPVTIYGTAEGSLYYINAEDNQNDVQWKNLLDRYGADILS